MTEFAGEEASLRGSAQQIRAFLVRALSAVGTAHTLRRRSPTRSLRLRCVAWTVTVYG